MRVGLYDAAGKSVDAYIPRKCSATSAIIGPKDHASVQIRVAKVDANDRFTSEVETYNLCGNIRMQGNADAALCRLTGVMC